MSARPFRNRSATSGTAKAPPAADLAEGGRQHSDCHAALQKFDHKHGIGNSIGYNIISYVMHVKHVLGIIGMEWQRSMPGGDMPYLKEPKPLRRKSEAVAPGIRRIVANNPSVMTYHGTNTYLLDDEHGTTVLDPGPLDEMHLNDVLEAVSGCVTRILLTHTHSDHVGNAAALRQATGAPIHSHALSAEPYRPDVLLSAGDIVAGMTVVHTPGHAADHVCFARGDGLLFSGDHVMGWSSTVVGPPHGNMTEYLESLRALRQRPDRLYLPGHGPALPDPHPYIDDLLRHRIDREAEIVSALRRGSMGPTDIARRLYAKLDPTLSRAAERNVLSHLAKLTAEGRVEQIGELWRSIEGERASERSWGR
jgi:glyoxylase-like metal-dependent hydrolase (beta-lactamase superfamily II)